MKRINLNDNIKYFRGIGERKYFLLKKLGIKTIKDLLYYAPKKYIDARNIKKIAQLKDGEEALIMVKVLNKSIKTTHTKKIFILTCGDETGIIDIIWFNMPFMKNYFAKGEKVIFIGKVNHNYGRKIMYHPEYEKLGYEENLIDKKGLIPVYSLTEGLNQKFMRNLIKAVFSKIEKINETIPDIFIKKHYLFSRKEALYNLHFPKDWSNLNKAKATLAYEELFYFFIALFKKRFEREKGGIKLEKNGKILEKFLQNLHFEFTNSQKEVIKEIEEDLKSGKAMYRLLQGDVGSGKTVVALYSMLIAIENGYQAVMMAPTEILAEQHFIVLNKFLKETGVNIALLEGSMPQDLKHRIKLMIEKHKFDLIVGTHGLIEEKVKFANLGLIVIDEQHRFGVLQREQLYRKGIEENGRVPHLLLMTATPIPRTLALTLYGDLDISILKEKPPNRGKILTKWIKEEKRKKAYEFMFEKIKKEDYQAFVVTPTIEQSEKLGVEYSLFYTYEYIKEIAPSDIKIAYIHGKMKAQDRQRIMESFRNKDFHILVATPVIEVGIDIPDANIMIIEHAERFGLSQLHQLRGRIGRKAGIQAYCILITPNLITEEAEKRLKIIEMTNDGFKIAEKDMEIRGPGEIIGVKQHGLPDFKFADLKKHFYLIKIARKDAYSILKNDPLLQKEENKVIKENLENILKYPTIA